MKSLKLAVDEYLNYRCNLGFILKADKLILYQFVVYLKKKKAEYVTCEHAKAFSKLNQNASKVSWAIRLAIIKRFTEYWVHMDSRTEIPITCLGSSTYQRNAPYIYSKSEIGRILTYCMTSSSSYEIDRYSYFIWFGLMVVTGMRTGEAERLDRSDLNLSEGILTIHNSKFRKSRQIPLHRSTVKALYDYLDYRDRCISKPKTTKLFISHLGTAISSNTIRKVFRKLLFKAKIQRTSSGRPRMIDFRHSFAVNTLIGCYTKCVSIDQKLILLSNYLGHVHLRHTYWYITITPKLLNIISNRLKRKGAGNDKEK